MHNIYLMLCFNLLTVNVCFSKASSEKELSGGHKLSAFNDSLSVNPAYCPAGAIDPNSEYISNIWVGFVNQNSSRGPGGYEDFTSQIIDIETGDVISMAFEIESPPVDDQLLIWVDWNIDGDFDDPGESVSTTNVMGSGFYDASFDQPFFAFEGITRMRIRLDNKFIGPNPMPCGDSDRGEVEDYSIRITRTDSCALVYHYPAFKAKSISGHYISLDPGRTIIQTAGFDDANSDPQDIGFPFSVGCRSFTQFVLNTNGFIKLGNTPPSAPDLFFDDPKSAMGGVFNSIDTADINIISPFNVDLTAGTETPEYSMKISGNAPHRICTIQYKNVSEKPRNVLPLFDNMQFQIRLYETSDIIEFVYGNWTPSTNVGEFRIAACGIKGESRLNSQELIVSKGSAQSWDDVHFTNANFLATSAIYYSKSPESPKPDEGRTLRFVPMYDHDTGIRQIYALGDASLLFSSPQHIAANIVNAGIKPQTNIPVTLTISGANSFSETKVIPSLAVAGNTRINFTDFTPLFNGATQIQISLPEDEDTTNNAKEWYQNTNDSLCNHSSSLGPDGKWGLYAGQQRIYYSKYPITGTADVKAVTAYILNDTANIGIMVYGVVLNNQKEVTGQSDPFIIQSGDLGSWHTFYINALCTFSNTFFYAGFAVTASSKPSFVLGSQTENPLRSGMYYYSNIDGTGFSEYTFPGMHMIGAILLPTAPVAGIATSDTAICEGNISTMMLSGFIGNIQWQTSQDGLTGWINVSTGTGGTTSNYTTESLFTTTYFRAEITQPTFASLYSNVIKVLIESIPSPSDPIIGATKVCPGDSLILYSVPEIANATSYAWTLPQGASGSSTSSSIIVNFDMNATTGDISVKGKNSVCDGLPSSLLISVNSQPSVPLIGNITNPSCTDSTGSVIINGLPPTDTWTLYIHPTGTTVSGTGPIYTVTGLTTGTYSFLVINDPGCTSLMSNNVVIDSQPATPPMPMIFSVDNILHSDASAGNQWYDQDGPIPGASGQDYTAISNGEYYTIVTLNGCSSLPSNTVHIDIVALNQVDDSGSINVFPNPVKDIFTISISENSERVYFEILNLVGQAVYFGEMKDKAVVEMNGFAPGMYMLRLLDRKSGSYKVFKVLKCGQ